MEYKMLQYRVEDGVAVVTLDYAPTLNALDLNMATELLDAFQQAENDPDVKVVVLTGAGRAFSGGGDIRYMKAHCAEADFAEASMAPLAAKLSEVVLYIKRMTKLVLCAVAGAAAGGGCNLAYACDLLFAADNAKFLQAFVGIGLMPDTMGGYLLPRMVGVHRAMEMFVSGRPVTALEGKELGFVNAVYPKDELLPNVMTYAKSLTKGPLHAYGNIKKLMCESIYAGMRQYSELERKMVVDCAKTEDFREGVTAFLEKRKPNYQGK
ncbi:MAG: enoyl-CoA hydratase/isomerase family protein [Succiniclasticum sp.]|jgi:enoyl-CoA hydratase/carnithine racemase